MTALEPRLRTAASETTIAATFFLVLGGSGAWGAANATAAFQARLVVSIASAKRAWENLCRRGGGYACGQQDHQFLRRQRRHRHGRQYPDRDQRRHHQ